MRKAEMVDRISEKTGISKVDVLLTLETFFKETMKTVAEGDRLYVRGFGTFGSKVRKAKIGRVIKQNRSIRIPETTIPYFKASEHFKEMVKK